MIMWKSFAFLLMFSGAISDTSIRFTNLKCESLDPAYSIIPQCFLKVLGRGIVGLNVQVKLLKGPLNNAKVNLSLWRKYNGFRPFLFNLTFDFCKYMGQNKNKLSYEKIFLDSLAENSNINHSCPYEDEFYVKNMILKEKYFKYFPLPTGEYQFQLIAMSDNTRKAKIYATLLRDEGIMKN